MKRLPLILPNPPRLSAMTAELQAIEASGFYSNGGPVVRRLEAEMTARLFGGKGDTLAVGNATLGLMIAARHAVGKPGGEPRFALMPAFTFAATAHAAQWAGLTPLFCDIEAEGWTPSALAEEQALRRHGNRIGLIMPYATFGTLIDLERYHWLSRRFEVPVVIDAAASLGTLGDDGHNFGAGAPFAIVYSMHATKTFATAEGGIVHSGDASLIAALRRMTNFGFGEARSADMPGLNAKLPEVLGLLGHAKLAEIDAVCAHRAALDGRYRVRLSGFVAQERRAARQAMQFMPLLLPPELAPHRETIVAALAAEGIGAAHYFSPHLGRQPWFAETARADSLPVTDAIAARVLSLPITDAMSVEDVDHISARLRAICADIAPVSRPARRRAKAAEPAVLDTVIIGGGPAGTALLTAASRQGKLVPLVRAGLAIVEKGPALGAGRLGGYAITSDSTAETFLTVAKGNPHPEIAALAEHRSAREIARHVGALGVPLLRTAPFLDALGTRLHGIVEAHGGQILTGHEAVGAERRPGGLWRTTLRGPDGTETSLVSRNLVIATGGHQPLDRLAGESIAGRPLLALANGKLVQSDTILSIGGYDMVRDLLGGARAPRIAILGGSTSALGVAALLLRSSPALSLPFGAGAVSLLHRRPLRPFYPSAEAARADGFTDFRPDDICPVSGFVYRLAGFRLEARELVVRMLGIGGREPDPRLRLHQVAEDDDPAALAILERADLVIAALGYRPHALPLADEKGVAIALNAHGPGRPPMVDRECRVIDAAGAPIPGLFGIGLAAGFVPHGRLGGEASFVGQANGLWLWQNDVGQLIVDQLLEARARAAA